MTVDRRALRLSGAPVVSTMRISVENELLGRALGGLAPFLLREGPRLPHPLRGRSWDRMEALGETFFDVSLRPRLRPEGVERVRRALDSGHSVVLESRALDHVVRPLARHLGVDRFVARRLEYRDGLATGRILPEAMPQTVTRAPRPYAVLEDERRGPSTERLSVRKALAGRNILLVGGSGFIGKVWLASLLRDLPELGRITLLLRPKDSATAEARLTTLLDECPLFDPFMDGSGAGARESLGIRVDAVPGDVSRPGLGLDPDVARRLARETDVVVSCAGLTEFNPDLRDAMAVNVEGMIQLLDFVRSCDNAALLHVSTCYVAGAREGRVAESLDPFETPNGTNLNPEAERDALKRMTDDLAEVASRDGKRRPIRRASIERGLARARELGWPNIYTFTKGLGEALIATHGAGLPVCVVRPSIVESSVEFPWSGWNEGINTSAPLSYLLGTPFRQLPVNERKALDVIPVDAVCRGMTLVAAALADRVHPEVVQLATSGTNPLNLRRAVELTALAHRKHYRQIPHFKSRLLERLEAIPVSRERYQRLSVPVQIKAVRAINRVAAVMSGGKRPLARAERALRRTQDLIDLYEPFLLDNEPVFEAREVELLSAALPDDERATFGWEVRGLDWYDYWVNVHIPALRRWSYPLIEGRRPAVDPRPLGPSRPAAPTRRDARPATAHKSESEWPRS